MSAVTRNFASAALVAAFGFAANFAGGVAQAQDLPANDGLLATLWTQRSVEFKGNALSIYALAKIRLDEALADKKWTAAPGEQIDGASYPWGWEQPEFDDSGWGGVDELTIGGPRGIALGKRRIRESLVEHRSRSPSEVNRAMLESLRVWQGEHHRRDDLTFFCFRT